MPRSARVGSVLGAFVTVFMDEVPSWVDVSRRRCGRRDAPCDDVTRPGDSRSVGPTPVDALTTRGC